MCLEIYYRSRFVNCFWCYGYNERCNGYNNFERFKWYEF